MKYVTLLLSLAMFGCNAHAEPIRHDFTSEIVSELALASLKETAPIPNVVPQPNVGTTCQNCKGTGKVGDGVVGVVCPKCKGTGKAQAQVEQKSLPPSPSCDCKVCKCEQNGEQCTCAGDGRPQSAPFLQASLRGDCANGRCSIAAGPRKAAAAVHANAVERRESRRDGGRRLGKILRPFRGRRW